MLAGTAVIPTVTASAEPPALTFTTLGTNSGPISRPERPEPANLVRFGSQHILIDAGGGAAEPLSKANVAILTARIDGLPLAVAGGGEAR